MTKTKINWKEVAAYALATCVVCALLSLPGIVMVLAAWIAGGAR